MKASCRITLVAVAIALCASASAEPEACRPAARFTTAPWWTLRLAATRSAILKEKDACYDLVLVGDSITHRWENKANGAEVYPKLKEKFKLLNLGNGGDKTQNVIWRFENNGELDDYTAKVFAVMIGVNNGDADPEGTIAGVKKIVEMIREKHPESKILLQAILPHGKNPLNAVSAKVINPALKTYAEASGLAWLDMSEKFLGDNGEIKPGLMMSDNLHPVKAGYEIWLAELAPVVERVLGNSFDSGVEAEGFDIVVASDRTNAVYRLGETTTFTVDVRCRNGEPANIGNVRWQINNFGDTILESGEHDLKDGSKFKVFATAREPGFLRIDVTDPAHPKKPPVRWGVAVSPKEIRPGTSCPADFLDFWKNAVAAYDREVVSPIVTTNVFEDARHVVRKIMIPAVGGRTVYGFFSVPKGTEEKYPLKVSFPGAGPSHWETRGGDKAFELFVNVHYYDIPQPLADAGEGYRELREKLQAEEDAAWARRYPQKDVRYTHAGIAASREEYFYYGVILAMNRAIDWAISQPGVDASRVYYHGVSQGGGLGLILMGLNGKFAGGCIFVPALTDLLSYKVSNRESGWPRLVEAQLDENRVAAERNAPYFCGVNFARLITCPIAYEVGFIDTVCPPHAGYAAFNVTPSRDKAMFHGVGQGHSVDPVSRDAAHAWFKSKTGFEY